VTVAEGSLPVNVLQQSDEFSHNPKPLWRALRTLNDRELLFSIILGFLLFLAGILDLLARSTI
jgi:hypothetical protein